MPTSPTLSRTLGKTLWYGYSIRLTDEQVRARFISRYGYEPQEVLRGPSVVLAGPVVEGLQNVAGSSVSELSAKSQQVS